MIEGEVSMKKIPAAPVLMLIVLAFPFLMWWVGDIQFAALSGLYVFFCIPSMAQICWVAYKDKAWPTVVRGPSVKFGRGGK